MTTPDPERAARPAARELAFLVSLAGLAGFNDGLMFTAFHTFVSFMSGNMTELGSLLGFDAPVVVAVALALVSFTLGAMLGDYLVDAIEHWGRTTVLAGETVLIGTAAFAVWFGAGKTSLVCLLALAMGVQNSALYEHSGVSVAVTGTVARLGRTMGQVIRGVEPVSAASSLLLLLLLWLLGACIGGLAARTGLRFGLYASTAFVGALLVWTVLDRGLRQKPLGTDF